MIVWQRSPDSEPSSCSCSSSCSAAELLPSSLVSGDSDSDSAQIIPQLQDACDADTAYASDSRWFELEETLWSDSMLLSPLGTFSSTDDNDSHSSPLPSFSSSSASSSSPSPSVSSSPSSSSFLIDPDSVSMCLPSLPCRSPGPVPRVVASGAPRSRGQTQTRESFRRQQLQQLLHTLADVLQLPSASASPSASSDSDSHSARCQPSQWHHHGHPHQDRHTTTFTPAITIGVDLRTDPRSTQNILRCAIQKLRDIHKQQEEQRQQSQSQSASHSQRGTVSAAQQLQLQLQLQLHSESPTALTEQLRRLEQQCQLHHCLNNPYQLTSNMLLSIVMSPSGQFVSANDALFRELNIPPWILSQITCAMLKRQPRTLERSKLVKELMCGQRQLLEYEMMVQGIKPPYVSRRVHIIMFTFTVDNPCYKPPPPVTLGVDDHANANPRSDRIPLPSSSPSSPSGAFCSDASAGSAPCDWSHDLPEHPISTHRTPCFTHHNSTWINHQTTASVLSSSAVDNDAADTPTDLCSCLSQCSSQPVSLPTSSDECGPTNFMCPPNHHYFYHGGGINMSGPKLRYRQLIAEIMQR